MIKIKMIIFLIVSSVFLLSNIAFANSAEDINWVSYDKALSMAKKQDKQILIYFFTKWCGYCKKMDKEVFANASIIKYLNKNFISVRLNTEKNKKNAKIASSYSVRAYPNTWFLTSNGDKISKLPGFAPANSMLNILKFIGTGSYEKMSFTDFTNKT